MPDAGALSLIILAVFLIFSAFFSSSEAAYLSLERIRIAHLVNTDIPGARRVSDMIEQPERLLSTILLGNNLVNVAFAAVMTGLVVDILEEGSGVAMATAVATGVGTLVLLIFGEIIPKTFAIHYAERVAFLYARPLKGVEIAFWPIVIALQWITRRTQNIFGVETAARESITEDELLSLIDIGEAEGTFEPAEAEMLENVFRFGDRQVREVMTPRNEIVSIERGATLGEFLNIYAQNSHTRFPVYREDADNIIGIISAKDILKAMANRGINVDDSVTDVIRDSYFVPETKRIAELFKELRQSGNQMAMAVDEYGGLAGLVTLKRLSEEVVGPVGEEGAAPEEEFEEISENTFQVDGGMSIDEANEEMEIDLPEGDFDTVAGFVLDLLGHIPAEGEQFEYNNLKLEIMQMDNLKIETIKLTKPKPVENGADIETDTD
ncbi:MAG: HlyC/CorC family transporter [Chloroflexi bacterium]|nr:HlyC/CorC family transporter [Chloroflexota bacterium]